MKAKYNYVFPLLDTYIGTGAEIALDVDVLGSCRFFLFCLSSHCANASYPKWVFCGGPRAVCSTWPAWLWEERSYVRINVKLHAANRIKWGDMDWSLIGCDKVGVGVGGEVSGKTKCRAGTSRRYF